MVVEKSSLTSNVSPSELVSTITIVNHLMLTMLKETLVVRGNKTQDQHLQEWIPWTCASGNFFPPLLLDWNLKGKNSVYDLLDTY